MKNFSEMSFNDLRAEAKAAGINTNGMNKETIIAILEKAHADGSGRTGRPVDPNSARQQKIKQREEMIAAGNEPKRGRPVNPESKRQKQLAARENGEVGHRGRPVNPNSARQIAIAAKQIKEQAVNTDADTTE